MNEFAENNPVHEPSEAPQVIPAPPRAHPDGDLSAKAFLVGLLGWAVPGAGHLLTRRWGRAAAIFAAVGALAVAGLLLRGNVFSWSADDPFTSLGFLADVGSGVFYFLAHRIEHLGPDVSRAAGDYGTRFMATAGVLNLLCVLDALEIARKRKE